MIIQLGFVEFEREIALPWAKNNEGFPTRKPFRGLRIPSFAAPGSAIGIVESITLDEETGLVHVVGQYGTGVYDYSGASGWPVPAEDAKPKRATTKAAEARPA